MIKCTVGFKSFIVPKASEAYVRRKYFGTEEEKQLVIVDYNPEAEAQASQQDKDKIIQKLK